MAKKVPVGKVTHYFDKISVAVIELSGTLKVGDKISIEGATTNVKQTVESMQIEYKPVQSAKKGESVGLKVPDRVREKDDVYVEK
jgi:putative protease